MTMSNEQLMELARIAARGHYAATADPDRSPPFDEYWSHNPVDRAVWLEIVKAVLTAGKAHDEFVARQGKPVPLPGLGAPLAPPGGAIPSQRALAAATGPDFEPQGPSVGSGYPFPDDPKPEGGPELAQWKRRNFARLYGMSGTRESFTEQFKRDHPRTNSKFAGAHSGRFAGSHPGFLAGLDMGEAEKRELAASIAEHDGSGNMPPERLANVRRMLALYATPQQVADQAAADIRDYEALILWVNPVYFGTLAGQGRVRYVNESLNSASSELACICVLDNGTSFRISGTAPTGGLFRAHVEGNAIQFVKYVAPIDEKPAGSA